MVYKTLFDGKKIPVIGFGTYTLGGGLSADHSRNREHIQIIRKAIELGYRHIDTAQMYGGGHTEELVGEAISFYNREKLFITTKVRGGDLAYKKAKQALEQSLNKLRTDYVDLYGIHSVNSVERLEQVTGDGGPLEAIVEAREAGMVRFIGITGHVPATLIHALDRFDFDSITFPYKFIQAADADYRKTVTELLQKCKERNTGVMIIKSIAKGAWGDQPQTRNTWYEPFSDDKKIQQAVNFVLSQDVTGLCTAGDSTVLPLVLEACQSFSRLSEAEQESLIDSARGYEPLFVSRLSPS